MLMRRRWAIDMDTFCADVAASLALFLFAALYTSRNLFIAIKDMYMPSPLQTSYHGLSCNRGQG